jgi:mono/diheme cytochrome c family protein
MIVPLLLLSFLATASVPAEQAAAQDEGRQLYRAACAACHGLDGRGQPRATVGFDTPLPDFTDCSFSTPEADADWAAIVHMGGPIRAFDRRMPAFGDALSARDIELTLAYVRTLCASKSWPRGDLNFPRPLLTEKAFPENETVLSTAIVGGEAVENELLYEQRLGPRSQFEVAIPVAVQKDVSGGWQTGLGDAAFAFKHVLYHSHDAGTIVSAAAEVILPTGKENEGFGKGVKVFEPFVAVGQRLPSDGFVQVQAGVELPSDREQADREAFWRTAFGKSFVQGGFGRSWTPMVEVVGAKAFDSDEGAQWDLVPQMQVSLSRRQHILINAGIRIPLTDRAERDVQVLTYFLWDWFDGGLFEGWR